jgi:hypothetical protein
MLSSASPCRSRRRRFLLALALSGCTSATDVDRFALEQLAEAESLWAQTGPPQAYSMHVTRITPDDPTPRLVRLQVVGSQITSAVYDDTEEPVPAAVLAVHRTVEGLFALVREAILSSATDLQIQYNIQYGYPAEVRIQYGRTQLSDFVLITVSQFQVGG